MWRFKVILNFINIWVAFLPLLLLYYLLTNVSFFLSYVLCLWLPFQFWCECWKWFSISSQYLINGVPAVVFILLVYQCVFLSPLCLVPLVFFSVFMWRFKVILNVNTVFDYRSSLGCFYINYFQMRHSFLHVLQFILHVILTIVTSSWLSISSRLLWLFLCIIFNTNYIHSYHKYHEDSPIFSGYTNNTSRCFKMTKKHPVVYFGLLSASYLVFIISNTSKILPLSHAAIIPLSSNYIKKV